MSNGTDIAAEVLAGLIEAGEATGDGVLICTVKRPGSDGDKPWEAEAAGAAAPSYFEVTAVQDLRNIRDPAGQLTGETRVVLLVDATGQQPVKSDLIAVGVRQADVDAGTSFAEIAEVDVVAPGGVPVLYEVTLED